MRALAAVVLVVLPAAAVAQTRPDLEYRDPTVDEDEDQLSVRGSFETQYYEFDNIDFRLLDETSDQAILDSDDRGAFAFTGAQLELAYTVDPQVRFVVAASHRGLWGDDQIGETNSFGGFVYFPAMYIDLASAPTDGVHFQIGRQFYSLGGLGGQRDYVLADVLDMVRVDVPIGTLGTWTLIPINVYSTASDYSEVDFVGLIGQQYPETFNFRGDVLTRRFGTAFDIDSEDIPVGGQAYVFYTDMHGRGTGSDISFQGLLGNFSDNDYVTNYGLRAHATFGPVTPFAELNGSAGIDRKEETASDVDTNGFAFGAGVRVDTTNEETGAGLTLNLRYFDAFGPAYAEDGLQYSHGYVGMKGQQVGGTLFNRFLGFHPSAYAGRNGIDDNPHDMSRKSGVRSIELVARYQLELGLNFELGGWYLQDTGLTYVDFTDLDNIQPPFGYSRSEFAAEERLGRSLGTELDGEVGWQFGDHVEIWTRGAIILPGSFYELQIDRVAGTALGSPDPQSPWAVQGGTRVNF